MTRTLLLVAVLAFRVPATNTSAAPATAAGKAIANSNNEDTKAEVMKAEESRNEALQKGDANALARLYTDDLIYTNALGVTLTRQQHLADIRSRKLTLTALKHTDVQVRIHGNAGFVTGISTSMVDFHGTKSDSPRKFLNVYVKENGLWKCAVHFETPAAKQ
jgi:ketosteroid isomerase-like protein